jgi:hypothetical protein
LVDAPQAVRSEGDPPERASIWADCRRPSVLGGLAKPTTGRATQSRCSVRHPEAWPTLIGRLSTLGLSGRSQRGAEFVVPGIWRDEPFGWAQFDPTARPRRPAWRREQSLGGLGPREQEGRQVFEPLQRRPIQAQQQAGRQSAVRYTFGRAWALPRRPRSDTLSAAAAAYPRSCKSLRYRVTLR